MIELDNRITYWKATKFGPSSGGFGLAPMKAEGGPANYDAGYIKQWIKKYSEYKKLPTKAKEAVACLSMSGYGERIPKIGYRVSQFVYWLEDPITIKEIENDNSVPKEE
jgi:hypothetical protein